MAGTNTAFPKIDWADLLIAYLHDPFDKALSVTGHESRAARYASAALGSDLSKRKLHLSAARADLQASIAEHIPSSTAGPNGARTVGPQDGLRLTHPASGACVQRTLQVKRWLAGE